MSLDTGRPIALLPVRLETRFLGEAGGRDLAIRIYPDAIHIDSHEPDFSPVDRDAHFAWHRDKGGDAKQAWRELVASVGVRRAAYLISLPADVERDDRDGSWTRAAQVALLPDRWEVRLYRRLTDAAGDVTYQLAASTAGAAIRRDLAVGLAPESPGDVTPESIRLGPTSAWMVDFGAAVDAGMAVQVPLPDDMQDHVDRLVVVGVREPTAGQTPDQWATAEATELARVLDAQRFTEGVGFLPAGTPTNNLGREAAPWSPLDPPADTVFKAEVEAPAPADGCSAAAAARALGLNAAQFQRWEHALDEHDAVLDATKAMRAALWPGTLGYFLDQMVGDLLPAEKERRRPLIEHVRELFTRWVESRGAHPILRIGRQPYGILPVVALTRHRAVLTGDEASVAEVIDRLRLAWRAAARDLPRVLAGGQEGARLPEILGMGPTSNAVDGRSVMGAAYASYVHNFIRQPLADRWWELRRLRAIRALERVGLPVTPPDSSARLQRAVYADRHFRITGAVVQEGAVQASSYLTWLAGGAEGNAAGYADIWSQREVPGEGPTPLLYRLARHAALWAYAYQAYEDLLDNPGETMWPRLEAEMIGMQVLRPVSRWLTANLGDNGPVGAVLDVARQQPGSPFAGPAFAAVWPALRRLSSEQPARLESSLFETLDSCGHRLDAWITALASRRLEQIGHGADKGIYLGGYGWVEDLRMSPRTPVPFPVRLEDGPLYEAAVAGGFIHAPSLDHATTAALLRSGYLSHRADGATESPFAVDLSSARARQAMEMLAGVRAGQNPGAMLGYRIERGLRERGVGAFIEALRDAAAINTAPDDPAAVDRHVIDGVRLVTTPEGIPWGRDGLPPAESSAADAIRAAIQDGAALLDAAGDLLVSEAVHRVAQGNSLRAATALDALTHGEAPPAEFDVLTTPRAGLGIEHRVLMLVPEGGETSAWAASQRATAEPALEKWSARLLGAPTRHRLRVAFYRAGAPATEPPLDTIPLTLADLHIGALDAVYGAGPATTCELTARALDVALREHRPALVPPDAVAVLVLGRDPTWGAGELGPEETVYLAQSLRELLGMRAAAVSDLALAGEPAIPDEDLVVEVEARLAGESPLGPLDPVIGQLATDPRGGLLAAAAFGVPGAVPDLDAARWPAQASSVTAQLRKRIDELTKLEPRLPAGGLPEERPRRLARAVRRLEILFGNACRIAPPFRALHAPELADCLRNQTRLLDDLGQPLAWLQRAARVREPAALLDRALFAAETLAPNPLGPNTDPGADLRVAQLPLAGSTRWIGLDAFRDPDHPPASRVSLVIHAPLGLRPDNTVAGLAVDGFSETIPAPRQLTGLALNTDQPQAQPPQAILLAVPAGDEPVWTIDAVDDVVRDALDLAAIRSVDVDALRDVGHYLPALYFALNLAHDTVSTLFVPEPQRAS